jgi:hypothetical protein
MAFLIPSGLHAKQLVDFCLMEKAATEMTDDHSCCESESTEKKTKDDTHQLHDCEWGMICACSIGQSQLGDEEWIPVSQDAEVFLAESEHLSLSSNSSEPVPVDQQIRIGEYAPPLWLLYDTFLM